MKKLKVFTAVLVVCLFVFNSVFTALGAVYIEDWGYRFEMIDSRSEYEINKYIGSKEVVTIPNKYNGYKIAYIGEYAFTDTSVTSVTLGANITEIKSHAFINADSLSETVLNDKVTAIPDYCFCNCTSLSTVEMNDKIESIGEFAFSNCTSLADITLPKSVTSIADTAFYGCDSLVISCYTDSYAHSFAEEKGISYVLLDAPVEVEFILGDVDNSGNVDIVDATFAQRYTTHADIPADILDGMVMRGDVDGNGDLDTADVTLIMRHLIRVTTPYSIGEKVTRVI